VTLKTGAGPTPTNDLFRVHDLTNAPALTIDGGNGSNTLQGPDAANTWQITGPNAGTLDARLSYSSVQNLTGGAAGDTFAFQNGGRLSGKIDGGGGVNALDYSAYRGDILVDLLLHMAGLVNQGVFHALADQGVFNVANVTGSQGNNLIVGDDSANVLT